ncbi:beta-2-glycoprotein 1-like [Hemiscyllium ocellatum]|uniref:beta-2-glycoprotein 1-like n=1 Tax=Hemiscyllium ocellatum TaxID=170820 RepID=UPI00296739D8|nr:beta-2-glycoprotein 1-like [Hemiscyllium ocellatum]
MGMVLPAYADYVLLTFTDPADPGRMHKCQAVYSAESSARINWAKCFRRLLKCIVCFTVLWEKHKSQSQNWSSVTEFIAQGNTRALGTERHRQHNARPCHVPKVLENGEMHVTDLTFGKQVYYSCNAGYILRGLNHSTCLHDGTWSDQHQFCEPVQCPFPSPPENGTVRFQTTDQPTTAFVFGDMIYYECKQGLALIGNETSFCLANGKWTNAPQCKEVKCGMPPKLVNGFMVFALKRRYNYRESIDYGCVENYILDGSKTIICEKTGIWTEKPTCRAPCILPVKRARIFYNGRKIWMDELPHRRILHTERVSFYCKDIKRNCGLPVLTQCIDSKIEIPACFQEPSSFTYNVMFRTLPSEIKQC